MTPSGEVVSNVFDESFFQQLGRSPGVVSQCDAAAAAIANIARSTAPVKTRAYRNSITTAHAQRSGRHVTEVIASDPAAVAIEAKFGTLARATAKARRK